MPNDDFKLMVKQGEPTPPDWGKFMTYDKGPTPPKPEPPKPPAMAYQKHEFSNVSYKLAKGKK